MEEQLKLLEPNYDMGKNLSILKVLVFYQMNLIEFYLHQINLLLIKIIIILLIKII